MAMYKAKFKECEAEQWLGTDESYRRICEFVDQVLPYNDEEGKLTLTTHGQERIVREKDFVVKQSDGSFLPYTEKYFHQFWELK